MSNDTADENGTATRPSMESFRAQVKKEESFRRADGTLGLKKPDFTMISEVEAKRRRILQRVS